MKEITKDTLPEVAAHGLYCFGAGRGLRSFAFVLKKMHLLETLKAVADNHATPGQIVEVEGRRIPVITPEELRRRIRGEAVIISCRAVDDIRVQLAAYPELADTPMGWYRRIIDEWILSQATHMTFPDGIGSTQEPCIPKIIHYCWFGGAPIPAEFQRYIDGWRHLCPDYEIRKWDESNYDVEKHPYMKAAYAAKKWAFVSDYARLDIVCEHGGIYLDTDVELVRSLDALRCNEAFMGMELSHRVNSGLGIGAVAHQPMMQELRDAYDGYEFVDFHGMEERWAKHIQICPDLQTEELERYGFVRDCFRMQDIRGIRIYPVPVLCGQVGTYRVVTDSTYAVHHFAGTWA